MDKRDFYWLGTLSCNANAVAFNLLGGFLGLTLAIFFALAALYYFFKFGKSSEEK